MPLPEQNLVLVEVLLVCSNLSYLSSLRLLLSRREKEAARALAAQERLTTRRARGDAAGPPDDEDLEYRRILQVGRAHW